MLVDDNDPQKRALPAIWNGLRCKCPRCSEGWLFHHYLEQHDYCSVCGEPLAYYKAGLFLPFVVITVVVHIVAVIMLGIELRGNGNPLLYLYVLVPVTLIASIAVLPSAKGAILGLMWSKGWSDEQDR
jgi:uncharacterized protein (DUF983 family)